MAKQSSHATKINLFLQLVLLVTKKLVKTYSLTLEFPDGQEETYSSKKKVPLVCEIIKFCKFFLLGTDCLKCSFWSWGYYDSTFPQTGKKTQSNDKETAGPSSQSPGPSTQSLGPSPLSSGSSSQSTLTSQLTTMDMLKVEPSFYNSELKIFSLESSRWETSRTVLCSLRKHYQTHENLGNNLFLVCYEIYKLEVLKL